MEEKGSPLSEAIFDNMAFWALVTVIIGLLYAVWASVEILNYYVVSTLPYTPFGAPGR